MTMKSTEKLKPVVARINHQIRVSDTIASTSAEIDATATKAR